MKIIKICFWCCLFFQVSVFSTVHDRYGFDDPKQSTRFLQLTKQLRCMVCQNQDLSESQAPLAMDLKNQLYEQLHLGKTDEAIKAYFVTRYGNVILYKPPFNRITYLLWCAPFLLLGLGFLLIKRIGRWH